MTPLHRILSAARAWLDAIWLMAILALCLLPWWLS